ncbi:hypothetical protein HK101_004951 [Irineochytrium annulatum]|nr:hypothetical protein HK101_004951 [Irineochytrium annulatum]
MPSPSDRIATECGIHPFARFYITARFADALLRPLASKCDDIPVHRLVLASQSPYFDDLFSRAPEQSTRLSTGQAVEVSPSEMAASAEEEEEEEEDEEEFNDAITMEEDEDEKESALGEPRAVASSFSPKVPKRFQETSPRSRQQPKTSPFSPADMATSCSSATAVSGDVVVGVYTVPIEDEAALRLTLEWFYFGDLDLDLIGCWGVMKAAREFKVPALAARVRGFVEAQVCANEGRSRSAECLTEAKPAMWGHEAWASAILGAVRAGVENALVERMVAASVRDLFMDEEQGIVGNEGNEERSFFDEDLEDDEEMRDEDSGGQQWVYRPSRAFRAYEILRRLVSQRDNDGDIISPTEMTALFSAVPFDRFRFRELEQIRGDARLPRDIVSNALMSGLMIREAQRTSMKKTFAAIVGMMAGGSMSSLPSQDPRMAPAVLKGSLATTSSITEIKSDDDEVRCAPPGSHVRTDEMKNPPPTAVAAENATGPAAPWLLEEGDGGGTVRVKQLNGKKKRGALNPSGSAPVANRKHFELIEDGCATVKGGLDGKLKPFPRRVRPSLSNCFDTSSVHSGKSDNSASASGDEDAVEEVVRHRESRALPLLPVQTATVEISESARPMETPPVTAIEPPAVVVRKMLAPPYTIGPPMTATPYPTVRQFIDQMKTDVIELKTVEVVRPLVAHQSVRISVPALAAPASEAPVSITAERSFSVEAIEDAAASRETSQGLPMQAPPRVAVPPSQQRIAGPTSQQQRDIGPPPPVGPMVVRKIPTPELLEKVAQKLLTIPADPDTRVQMPQEKVQTEARRQSERPYETEPAPQAWKGLADNKRNFWAGGVAPYAVVERVPRNVDGGEEDDPPLMSVRKEQQQRRKSQPALAAVSETLPTPGASFDGSPKAGTLPREMPAPSVTTQPTFSTAPVSTNGSTIATDVEDDDDRASDCSSTTSGGDRTFTQNPRMRKHRHLQSAKQSRQRQKEISQKLNGGKRLKNATSMPIMATQAREDEPLQPLPPPMRMLGPTGSLGAMMNVNPDEIVPDPRYVAPISPMTLMPGLVNTNKSMPPTPKILSGASNTIAYGEHAPLTGPRAATNMAGIHSKGDDTLLDKVDFGGGLDLNFKLNDSAEGSRNTSFSFEGTRDDASFHWPDTAPMGGSAVDSRPHSRSSSVSSSTSTNRSSSPSRDLLIQNVGMKVPNPVRRSKRIPSGLAVNTGAAAGGAAKQHVVGTWGPSSNPFKAAIGGQGREYNRSSTPAGSAGLAPAVSSSWGYQQGASMMEDVRKADGQRVIAVKNETDQNTMGPPYVAAPATSRGVVSQQGPSKGGSRKYTLSKKQIKEFMGNVLKF